jgi:hypothetical protein
MNGIIKEYGEFNIELQPEEKSVIQGPYKMNPQYKKKV